MFVPQLVVGISLISCIHGQTGDGGSPSSPQDGYCADPGVPANGFRVGNDLSRGGSGVMYICNNGFTLSGIERSKCGLDGTWSSSLPQCVGGAVIQPSVSPPCRVQTYGSPTSGSSQRIGDHIIYECDFNHRLLGTRNISCFEPTPLLPRCVWLQSDPCAFRNGGCDQICLNEGGLPLCQCNPPQVISPVAGTSCETCPCECPRMAADVIIAVDEGSVGHESRKWLYDLTGHLEQELIQGGFGAGQECSNLYGMVAYGGQSSPEAESGRIPMSLEGTAMSNWTNFLQVLGNFETESITVGQSDGYAAIKYALDKLPLRMGCPSVTKLLIHLTNRDRDAVDVASGKGLIQQRLQFEKVIMHSIAQSQFLADGQRAFGVHRDDSSSLTAYLPSQSTFYRRVTQNVQIGSAVGSSVSDYVELALAAGGGAFDITRIASKDTSRALAVSVVDNSLMRVKQVTPCDITDSCADSPCLNGGTCVTELIGFTCQCPAPFSGFRCQQDACSDSPCLNGGACRVVGNAGQCTCSEGYTGATCNVRVNDPCQQLACQNGGSCVLENEIARCVCPADLTGPQCIQATSCFGNPCQYGGVCSVTASGFSCDCQPGFAGPTCEPDVCYAVPCKNGATCSVSNGSPRCICSTGFSGDFCDIFDTCALNPCNNNGDCSSSVPGSFECACYSGFSGVACNIAHDDLCRQLSCQNGASCLVEAGTATCKCLAGYAGPRCEQDLCRRLSCQNSARCLVEAGTATCRCQAGFTGQRCEQALSQCTSNPCQNGGTCSPSSQGYTCRCARGFLGPRCQQADPCVSNPCPNGGTCKSNTLGYTCDCAPGYIGANCRPDLCFGVPCQNGGRCILEQDSPRCVCPAGYTGFFCQQAFPCSPDPCSGNGECSVGGDGGFQCSCFGVFIGRMCNERPTDLCFGVPCQNGGRCILEQDSPRCVCVAGYTGTFCQQEPLGCVSNPCGNGGTCSSSGAAYRCRCLPGYYGDRCQSFTSCERAGGCVDVAFVVDESASAQVDHVRIPQLLASLERGFLASQLGTTASCRNRYGVVGFGRRVPQAGARVLSSTSGQNMVSAAEAGFLAQQLTSDAEGRLEDGYQAVNTALEDLSFRTSSQVEKFIILVTDEDRDTLAEGRQVTRSEISRKLLDRGFALYAIVDNRLQTQASGGISALGLSWPGPWYTLGNCQVTQGGGIGLLSSGFSETTRDYATLALEVGGGAFDIQRMRSTLPDQACAFTKSLESAIVGDACRIDKLPVTVQVAQSPPKQSTDGQCVDTIIVIDVSRNMASEISWLPTLVERTEIELTNRGYGRAGSSVCRNRYAIVVFARAEPNESGAVITNHRGEHLVPAADFSTLASRVVEDPFGRKEDGYQAIDHALKNINLRQRTSPQMFRTSMVLISDEDRDIITAGEGLTFETILQGLRRLQIALHVVVDQEYTYKLRDAIGTDRNLERAFFPRVHPQDRTCSAFSSLGPVTPSVGFSGTNRHYTQLAMQLGGSAWNDNLLKQSQQSCTFASSMAKAMANSIQKQSGGASELSVCVDTVIIVDASRNTQLEHDWVRGAMGSIDTVLQTNGYGNSDSCKNMYAVVMFGRSGPNVNGRILFSRQGEALVPIERYSQLASQIKQDTEGSIEDGYEAIQLAFAELPLRQESNVFSQVLLISDEDRDVTGKGRGLDRNAMTSLLRNSGFHVVVDNGMTASGNIALGVSLLGPIHAFLSAQGGWFVVETEGVAMSRGYAMTKRDYVQLALDMNGSAWDVNELRKPANSESAINAMAFNMVKKLNQLLSSRNIALPKTVAPSAECWFGDRCSGCDRQFVGNIMGQQVCCSNCAQGYPNITADQGCKCVVEDIGCADILVVMDESKNTRTEHAWLPTAVQYIERQLQARGIGDVNQRRQCPNLYSLVGFGRRDVQAHLFRDARGLDSVSARNFIALASTLSSDVDGYLEDGYHALDFGMEQSMWRLQRSPSGPTVARAVVLVTDEDWDQTSVSEALSRDKLLQILSSSDAAFHVLVDQQFNAGAQDLLGVSLGNQGYMQLPGGQYQQVGGATVGRGFARTTLHYTSLALEVGGSAWNVLKLRDELARRSITAAFGDVVTRRIAEDLVTLRQSTNQPDVTLQAPRSVSNGRCWIGAQCNSCDPQYTRNFIGRTSPRLCCAYCAKGNASIVPALGQSGQYTCTCSINQGSEKD